MLYGQSCRVDQFIRSHAKRCGGKGLLGVDEPVGQVPYGNSSGRHGKALVLAQAPVFGRECSGWRTTPRSFLNLSRRCANLPVVVVVAVAVMEIGAQDHLRFNTLKLSKESTWIDPFCAKQVWVDDGFTVWNFPRPFSLAADQSALRRVLKLLSRRR